MDADSAMGDNFNVHCLDSLDAEEHSMLPGFGQDGSSRSRWVSGGSSYPDGRYSSPVASAAAASSRNVVVTGSLRGRKLNDKLYALRSVVPSITKMDKVSIIKDAVEYVQQLQEQERQLLAEISILESAAPATHEQQLLGTVEWGASAVVLQDSSYVDHAVPPMKKMRTFRSSMAATSNRMEALEVSVTAAGDKVLLVSVACRHRKDAMAKVCLALDGMRLAIISSNVTSASGTLKHTALVQSGDMPHSKMKEVIETAIAQVDVVGSTLSSMSY